MGKEEQEVGQFSFGRDLISAMIRSGNYLGLTVFQAKGHPEITTEDIENAAQVAKDLRDEQPGGAVGRRGL